MPVTSDRRHCDRTQAKWPVTALVGRSEVSVELGNVSPTGALIYGKEPIPAQKEIRLFMKAPDNRTLQAQGVAVWSLSADAGELDLSHKAGIRFTQIANDDRQHISRMIAGADTSNRWPQLRRSEVFHLLSLIVVAILIAISYFHLNAKIGAISQNVFPGPEKARLRIDEKALSSPGAQDDSATIPAVRPETITALRDIGMITDKINSVLLPEIEGLRRHVYGQSATIERITLSSPSHPGKEGAPREPEPQSGGADQSPSSFAEPQAAATERPLDARLALLKASPTATTPESYRRLRLGPEVYGVTELTTLDSALAPRDAEKAARESARTKLLTLIESRIAEILGELARGTGKEQGSVIESWAKRFPERIGGRLIPVVTLSQVSQGEGKRKLQVVMTVKKGEVLPLVQDEVEKEIVESNKFSPEERKEAQSKFKAILEAESRKSTDVLWKIL
jgi:hypothetical protein